MAENTSVGSVSISLDIDVSSNLEKQISSVSENIAKSIKTNIEKSTGKSDLSKSVSKSLSATTKDSSKIGTKIGEKLVEGIKKATSKVGETLTGRLDKQSDKTPIKESTVKPRSSISDTEILNEQRDTAAQLQENINQRIRNISISLKEMSQHNPAAVISEDFLKLEEKMLNLTRRSNKLSISIKNLDEDIDAIETSEAEASVSRFGRVLDRLKNAGRGVKNTFNSMNDSNKKLSNSFKSLSKESAKSSKPLVNMKSFGRSLVRQMLGLQLILRLVGQGVRKMAQSFWSSLKTNEQFSNSLNQIKSNLATAFQPIYNAILPALNALMSALAKVTAYLATFISMLFGKSVKASNASAKALDNAKKGVEGYGQAVKEAQRITAGFDQLHDITESKDSGGGSGGGGSTISPVEIDENEISNVEKIANKIKDVFKKVFSDIKPFTDMIKNLDLNPLRNSFISLGHAGKDAFLILYNSAVRTLNEAIAPFIEVMVEEITPNAINAVASAIEMLTPHLDYVLQNFIEPFTEWLLTELIPESLNLLIAAFELLIPVVDSILEGMKEWYEFIKPVFEWLGDVALGAVEGITESIQELTGKVNDNEDGIADLFKGVGIAIGAFLTFSGAVAIVSGIVSIATPIVKLLTVGFTALWNIAKIVGTFFAGAFSGSILAIIALVGVLVTALVGLVTNFDQIKEDIGRIIGNIVGFFKGLINFIAGVFTGDWKRAFKGLADALGNAFAGVINIAKFPINVLIDGVNAMIRGLNKVKIPSWVPLVGGKGININEIPRLATGAVLKQPTLNIAGEYPGATSNPEIVTPQNTMKDTFREVMNEFKHAFGSGHGLEAVSQGAINLVVNIGGNKLLDMIIELAKEYTKQTGKQVIINA